MDSIIGRIVASSPRRKFNLGMQETGGRGVIKVEGMVQMRRMIRITIDILMRKNIRIGLFWDTNDVSPQTPWYQRHHRIVFINQHRHCSEISVGPTN